MPHPKTALQVGIIFVFGLPNQHSEAADVAAAIAELRSVTGKESPTTAQAAWRTLSAADVNQLTTILEGMKDASPLAENWLRSACDAVVERQLRSGNELPVDQLRAFALDSAQSPRARRSAYEWLVQAVPKTPDQLLPKLLDDPSLELRYDAVEHLLNQASDSDGNQQKIAKLQQALDAARNFDQINRIADQLEKLEQPANLTKQLGFITDWHWIGPFDIADGQGFSTVYPPEETIDFTARYSGRDGEVVWTEAVADGERGLLDFGKTFGKDATGVIYAVATFDSPEARPAQLRYDTGNATKLWFNGELVADNEIYHAGSAADQYIVPIDLRKGENTILIKVCQTKQTQEYFLVWRFRLRITDELGGALRQPNQP